MRKILLLLTWICLASCTSDSLTDEPQQGTPLEIRVDVVAYNQDVDDVATRASVNSGVITSFAPGDDLGIIVTDKSRNVVINNYRFIVQKTGLAYRADEGGNIIASDIYYDKNYTYFAYAPYNSQYNGYQSLDAIIEKHKADIFTLYNDQSTQATYNAADLLVCKKPQPTGTTLRLKFTHAMSLMKIFYNGEASDLTVEKPVELSNMYKPEGSQSYSYIYRPSEGV